MGHLTRGCMECHGVDGAGHVVIDDKESGFFVRALRHGVKPCGEPLFIMPSEEYAGMTDADVGAIAAYVRSLPPADTGGAEFSPFMFRTGKRPDGSAVSDVMPFTSLAYMSDA